MLLNVYDPFEFDVLFFSSDLAGGAAIWIGEFEEVQDYNHSSCLLPERMNRT